MILLKPLKYIYHITFLQQSLYLLLFSLFFITSYAQAQFQLDTEFGASFNTKNDIRFPNDATSISDRVNVPEEFGIGKTAFFRLQASYTIAGRHTILGLFAPLTFNSSGNFSEQIRFGNNIYSVEDITDVSYKFNSYRLTYRYRIVDREKIKFGLGLTGKIRDARIGFSSGEKSDETTDLGFVPLINFRFDYYATDKLLFTLNGDALVGPVGRAEDIFAGFEYLLSDLIGLKAGYRILEGGADIDQVYNFSLIQYASLGVILSLK